MKEAYVSYETAKLLREKGFDWDTDKVYERNLMACRYEDYPMPTQQMACSWLREMKNIDIEPFVYCNHHDGSKAYGCNIQENGHLLMTKSFV